MAAREDGRQSKGSWAVRLRMGDGGQELWKRYGEVVQAGGKYPDRSAALRAHIAREVAAYDEAQREQSQLWTTGDDINAM